MWDRKVEGRFPEMKELVSSLRGERGKRADAWE